MKPKFRVWDRKLETMYKPNELIVQIKGPEILVAHDPTLHQFNNYSLMQSTGLEDKNGKEIYEGDIVSFKYPYDKRMKSIGNVVWCKDKACFGINMEETTEQYELYKVTAEQYLTIIGNIYEKSNLLKETVACQD
ncbi:YopX family protein [Staphylococcus agnetis]|uniref:YopX family protein n=1 Tax=Staphylococcus agnetis TaxID=985762 RepID=UPI0021CF57C4|nr:YopX family protein [Staphylococcus agnetis]UXU54266.1 YopX family protein [Staphylococcus agnetis]